MPWVLRAEAELERCCRQAEDLEKPVLIPTFTGCAFGSKEQRLEI